LRLLADGTPAQIKASAGARRISFRLEDADEPFLRGLPGLTSLDLRRDLVQIQSTDSDRTLFALLDAGYRPCQIEITGLDLEQAFLAITAANNSDTPAETTRRSW
jgi:ABC-2 type transport system ATP-binding protein